MLLIVVLLAVSSVVRSAYDPFPECTAVASAEGCPGTAVSRHAKAMSEVRSVNLYDDWCRTSAEDFLLLTHGFQGEGA